jgi:hypothetical protein
VVGEQARGLWDGQRDHAGVGGRWLIRVDWRRRWVPVWRRSTAAVMAPIAPVYSLPTD